MIGGEKIYETVEGLPLKGEVRLQSTKTIKILLEGKDSQIAITTKGKDTTFPSLLVSCICR